MVFNPFNRSGILSIQKICDGFLEISRETNDVFDTNEYFIEHYTVHLMAFVYRCNWVGFKVYTWFRYDKVSCR